ncbi:MAG: M48 family metallopeptidase [bacterium]
MNHENYIISFEETLKDDIFSKLKGNIVNKILKDAKIDKWENHYKYLLEGYSFQVTPEIAPELYQLFELVRKKIEYNEDVNYYITNSAETNAFCVSKLEDDETNLMVLHSELLERLTNEELKFIIGHEFGHLINKNNEIKRTIQFLFPDDNQIPLVLHHKIKLWDQLSELSADRFGFIACESINTILSTFLKLSSGLDPENIGFNMEAYLQQNLEKVELLKRGELLSQLSHPFNPARIKALDLFAKSELNQSNDKPEMDSKQLEAAIKELIDIIMFSSTDELDIHRQYFIATAGLIAGGLDKKISEKEYKHIVDMLAGYMSFPKVFLETVFQSDKIHEYFETSIKALMKLNPQERYGMFSYLINVLMADRYLYEYEIDFLYKIGEKKFGFTRKEIAQRIAQQLQDQFVPDVLSSE